MGSLLGGSSKGKIKVNRYLDNEDMTFKELSALPENNILMSDESFKRLLTENQGDFNKEGSISKLSALREASIYAGTHKRVVILKTR